MQKAPIYWYQRQVRARIWNWFNSCHVFLVFSLCKLRVSDACYLWLGQLCTHITACKFYCARVDWFCRFASLYKTGGCMLMCLLCSLTKRYIGVMLLEGCLKDRSWNLDLVSPEQDAFCIRNLSQNHLLSSALVLYQTNQFHVWIMCVSNNKLVEFERATQDRQNLQSTPIWCKQVLWQQHIVHDICYAMLCGIHIFPPPPSHQRCLIRTLSMCIRE